VLHLGNPVRVRRRFSLGHQGRAFGIGLQDRVQQRGGRRRHFLRHPPDPRPAGQGDFAALQRQLAPDQAEQRGLSGAVAPDKPHLVAIGNRRRCPFEQGAAFDGKGDVGDAQHGRSLPEGRGRVNRRAAGLPPFQAPWPVLAGPRNPGAGRGPHRSRKKGS